MILTFSVPQSLCLYNGPDNKNNYLIGWWWALNYVPYELPIITVCKKSYKCQLWFTFLWLISRCSLPVWSSLPQYVGLCCPDCQAEGGGVCAVDHVRGFFPLPALQQQLYNKQCCHKWCDIFDGAAASAREAGVRVQRVRKSTGPGVETGSSAPASLFPRKLGQVYPQAPFLS